MSGIPCTYPEQRTNGRFNLSDSLLGHSEQLAADGTSMSPGPGQQELPLTQRPTQIWVNSHVEPRWGHGLQSNWDGNPTTFYPPHFVDPQVNPPMNPFVHYPQVSRGHPIPYGDTVPVLGG